MEFDLRAHTILLTVAGSRAYGMNTPESDVDLRGVCIPPPRMYLGILGKFEQADSPSHMSAFCDTLTTEESAAVAKTKLEGSVYELKKFISLAADANPNNLDALFCDDEHVRICTGPGRKLRENRHLFLTARVNHTLRGYAGSQLKRIKSHRKWLLKPPAGKPQRADYGLPETGLIPKDKLEFALDFIKKKTDSWEADLSLVPSEADRLSIMERINNSLAEIMATTDSVWKSGARASGFSEEFTVAIERERAFRLAQDDWVKYSNWKRNRNPERAAMEAQFGYDLKHASHLYRLATMAKEVLLTGQLHVNRKGIDADFILSIRRGAWTYEQLLEWFEKIDEQCLELYNERKYTVPHHPDMNKINDLCIEILKDNFE